jgi:hypothetical protein
MFGVLSALAIFSSIVVSCSMLWVCLQLLRTGEFFRIKNKQNGAKHRQNPRGKLGSVFFPPDTGK